MKRIICLIICAVFFTAPLFGCGASKNMAPTNPDGSYVQVKKCIVAYNSSGYGNSWLKAAEAAFEKAYAAEGYDIELKISFNYENNAALEIGTGPERNDVDLYIGAGDMEQLLDTSKKIMRDGSPVLVDLTDEVWNKPAIGIDRKEEEKTIAERYLLDKEYLLYDGDIEAFHDGIYALPITIGSCGIVLNPKVTEKYGYGLDNLPRTTDEFNAMCEAIAAKTPQTNVYAYAWPGGNASGYITYLFYEYFAQYSGKEAFMNFVKTVPYEGATVDDIIKDGWKVYEDKGILEGLRAMDPILETRFSPPGSASMTHLEAQHEVLVGNAAFIMNGDWVLNEMEEEYYTEASQCVMMNTPVLSVIGKESGITDAQLSQAVGMIDEGKTNAEIIASISGLDDKETQRIRDARNIYSCGDKTVRGGACIPSYADGKDVAVLFLRFLCSEDGCQIIRDEAYNIAAFSCDSYQSKGDTVYMDSVVSNINPGHGQYISMDAGLSIVRANSGMLPFNHPACISPQTFRTIIMDSTGTLTPEYIYENEKSFARAQWSQWAAYVRIS